MQSVEATHPTTETGAALPPNFFPSIICCDNCDRAAPDVRERGDRMWSPGERWLCQECSDEAWEVRRG